MNTRIMRVLQATAGMILAGGGLADLVDDPAAFFVPAGAGNFKAND